jgi:DNA-binding response OmpR family regulator
MEKDMPTILVIEEEDIIRGLIRVMLEGAGYQVADAATGDAGLQMARNKAVEAVVLDCMGRRSDGVRVLRKLRGDAATAHLPVIALCGLGQSGGEIGLWANALVVKPFRPAQLLIKVQSTLPMRPEPVLATEDVLPRASA